MYFPPYTAFSTIDYKQNCCSPDLQHQGFEFDLCVHARYVCIQKKDVTILEARNIFKVIFHFVDENNVCCKGIKLHP